MANTDIDTSETNKVEDFGFSFQDEDDKETLEYASSMEVENERLQDELKAQKNKTRDIMKKITKLMNNLKKNPEKTMIKWPNRSDEIENFLEELNEIYKDK